VRSLESREKDTYDNRIQAWDLTSDLIRVKGSDLNVAECTELLNTRRYRSSQLKPNLKAGTLRGEVVELLLGRSGP